MRVFVHVYLFWITVWSFDFELRGKNDNRFNPLRIRARNNSFHINILLCCVNFSDGLKRKFRNTSWSSFIKLWAILFLYLIETSRIEWNSSILVAQLACSFFFLSKLIINKYVSQLIFIILYKLIFI